MKRIATCLALTIVALAAGECSADLIISQYDPLRNDRFGTNSNPAFVAAPYDLSPVGDMSSGHSATLVSQNFALTAAHLGTTVGTTITFYEGDTKTVAETATVAGVTTIVGAGGESSDLELLRLTVNTVTTPVIPVVVAADQESQLLNAQIFVYGEPDRVGTNNITVFQPVTGTGFNPTYGYLYTYDPSVSPNEALLNGGDSGGPSLTVGQGNVLELTGVHTGVGDLTNSDGSTIPVSVDTSVGHYIPAIESAIDQQVADNHLDAQQITVRAVPEPASLTLLGVGFVAVATRLRRRSA